MKGVSGARLAAYGVLNAHAFAIGVQRSGTGYRGSRLGRRGSQLKTMATPMKLDIARHVEGSRAQFELDVLFWGETRHLDIVKVELGTSYC